MDIAKRVAEESFCKRMQAGAVVVKDDNILAFGLNGMPSGMENTCEDDTNTTKPEVLHAEENLFLKLARSTESCKGATIYITANPCIKCARQIFQVGIRKVYYERDYRLDEGTRFLIDRNVRVYKLNKKRKRIK
jgi:dCMP deaminase